MIAYVVRCDVCAAEAFVPLNQDPDMAMSARGWRMRPHSKVCPDCVFALEGPKIPPSMAEVRRCRCLILSAAGTVSVRSSG